MLSQYRCIIYKDKETFKNIENECVNSVLNIHQDRTKEDVITSITLGEVNDINADYYFALLMAEGRLLFEVAEKKFGRILWSTDAWRKKDCKKRCPFGNICKKELVQIDDVLFCYGQLYYRRISENIMIDMTKNKSIKVLKPNGEVYIDLSCSDYDEQLLSEFFFRYEWFIWWFGDNGGRNGGKVNGGNVIPYL